MKIDISVYTAIDGYGWQSGSVHTPQELARFKKLIGIPDSLDETLPFGGVLTKNVIS